MYRKGHKGFFMVRQQQPIIEIIGGTEPTDELLEWLADFLLDLVEAEEAGE